VSEVVLETPWPLVSLVKKPVPSRLISERPSWAEAPRVKRMTKPASIIAVRRMMFNSSVLQSVLTSPGRDARAARTVLHINTACAMPKLRLCSPTRQILEHLAVTQGMQETGRMDCRTNRHSIRQVAKITTFFSEAFCFFVTSDQTDYGARTRRSVARSRSCKRGPWSSVSRGQCDCYVQRLRR
jgi:hypothetical protein